MRRLLEFYGNPATAESDGRGRCFCFFQIYNVIFRKFPAHRIDLLNQRRCDATQTK